ncbi:MAG: leucine-rich repeat domain-containing protein, partial [Clostridiales bacterium]|nr:leucine-rich repeat domain-containing protein [Clostridiales bacterium]
DMTIAGDLYLAEGIGEGEITLDRVTVQGNTIVKGGGIHSIIIKDCQFSKLIITKEDGKIRILATGSTTINETQLRSGAILEQEDISGEGFGYIVITESLDEDELIELVGDYDSVEIRAKGIQVQVSGGTIGNLEIAPEAANTNIKLAQGSQVTNLTANAPVTVTGKGTIQTALVNTDGTKIETPVAKLETAPGIKVDAKVEEPSPKSRGGGSTKTVPISAVIIVEDVAKVGETLTAKVTPDTATVRYQWQIAEREDGEYEDIDGATGKTYKPDGEDIDKYIRVVVKGYGSYSGTKTSAAVGPVGAPEYSIYKLSYADLADSYVVVDSLIGTDEWGKAINNTEVEQAISGLTPVKLTLETEIEGKNGYGSVRIKPVEAGENIQFWAKDEDGGGNWYNINISGWGDPSGFELPAQYTATTHIYILSNKVGTYDLTVQLVKVGNNEVIAQVEGTIRIRDKERSEYGFEIEDADQVFVAGELLDSSGIIAGEDGVDTTGLTPVKVTLKAIQIKELGYEQVRVLPPDVTQTEGSGGQLQFWAYSEDDGLWFDAAVHGWGDGFELTPDYKKTTEVYVFADAAGTYEVTFKLVEWSESGQVGEPIATRTATITVISQEMAEEINKAKAAIKPSWEVGGVEPVDGDEALPSGVENVDYKVTIKTSYDDKEAAQASGRTVTTLFTIPDGVTVWYPVWKEGQLTYQSDSSGEVALGMEGHPLNENNIDADGVVYVALGETTETKFTVTIKLVDADEEWQGVVYGEQELEIKVPEVSEYGFEFEDNIEIIAGNILEESEYDSDGTELGGLTVSDLTPTTVTLKPTIENELGYKKVRILPLVVNGPTDNSMLQVWIYDSKDGKWYDMVQKGWGSQGTGFTLGANENKEMKVYVFADTSGTYTVTFKAVDTSDPENEIVIAEETTTIFAPFHFDAGTRTISKYEGDKENITIPAAVNGVSVKAIGEGAFEENQHIKTVTFAEGSQLKTIGKEAFKECNDLESITIPASVTSIGEGAFVRCKALKSVDIPENVTSIEDYTFYGCENLKSITIPGVKEIKFFALSDTALESIT